MNRKRQHASQRTHPYDDRPEREPRHTDPDGRHTAHKWDSKGSGFLLQREDDPEGRAGRRAPGPTGARRN